MPPSDPDPQQSRVIGHDRGAMRVRGDAGTGKSTALRLRFVRLVGEGDPERIALVMRSRPERDAVRRSLHGEIRRALPSLNVITMQALARLVLGARAIDAGTEAPEILSAADQFALVRELLDAERPEDWPAYGRLLGMRGFADEVRQFLLRAQEAMRTPEDIADAAAARALGGWAELAAFYRRYLDVLVERNRVDFAGLVWLGAIAAAEGVPALDHLMVDDFQDATPAGLALVVALRARTTVVAGNAHAHVFSFQGTTDAPFLELDRHLPDLTDVELLDPWRGRDRVVEAWHAPHVADEHRAIARELRRIHVEDGVAWRDLAVVVRRQGANLASVVRGLDDARIPHHVPEGGVTFATESATWPYTVALAWIADPERRDALVDALLTSRLAGLSPGAARGLVRAARRNGAPPAGALDRRDGLTADEAASLDRLRAALADAAAQADNVADAFTALWHGLDLSGALVADAERGGDDLDAVLALSAAVNEAAESPDPSVEAFVRALEARGDTPELARLRDSGADAVAVLTAHATAGREFDTVVLAGAVEGDFPSLVRPEPMFDLSVLDAPRSESARNTARLADERRLFDLVVGRARRRVLLTASDAGEEEDGTASRSRFVEEARWAPAPAPDADAPTSVDDAILAWRRTLADRTADPADRLLALDGLLAIGERPSRWWFLGEWTRPDVAYAGPRSLSFSRMKGVLECELRYALGQEFGLEPPSSGHAAALGSLIHELVEDCDAGAIPRDLDALIAAFDERFDPSVFPSRAAAVLARSAAVTRMLPNWLASFGPVPATAAEVPFAFDIEGMRINGRIDRIGPIDPDDPAAGSRITDYKTGTPKGRSTDQTPNEDDALQLRTYLVAAHRDPSLAAHLPIRQLDVAYLRGENRGGTALRIVPMPGDPDAALGEAEEEIAIRVRRVQELAQEGTYPARPSFGTCRYCPFATLCPAHDGASPVPVEGAATR